MEHSHSAKSFLTGKTGEEPESQSHISPPREPPSGSEVKDTEAVGDTSSLNSHDNAFQASHEQLSQMDDREEENLEKEIACHHEALRLGHPGRSSSLNSLANALCVRYERLGRMDDLEAAVAYYREALHLCPRGHPDHSDSLSSLANALRAHHEQLGLMEDLKEAIAYHREALSLRPVGHPDRSSSLNNLATVLWFRHSQLDHIEDLEEAITYHREALRLRPHGHPGRSYSLNNLATVLCAHHEQLGRMDDLEDAIAYFSEALCLRPLGHPNRSESLYNFANALLIRHERLGLMDDLEEAIEYCHEALRLCPHGHPDHSESLNNLANALRARHKQLGRVEDLEEAIACYREGLSVCPLGHLGRPIYLSNLANALRARHEQLGQMEDLEEAIAYHREALSLRPVRHPDRSSSFNNLAVALQARHKQLGRMEDLEESFVFFEQAINDSVESSNRRLAIAIRWANIAQSHHHGSTIHAYLMSFSLLDRCLISYPTVDSQHKFLATANIPRSFASDAASAAIVAGNLEAAVELLEQGRAILWSKMSGYRHPLDHLRQVDRQLADNLETLNGELEHLALSYDSHGPGGIPKSLDHLKMKRCRILSEQWEETVGRIRTLDGFSNFLQAVPFTTLRQAAMEGPVILVNISHHRSDAIILDIDNPPILVSLPDVQPQYLVHLGNQLASVQASVQDPHAATNHSTLLHHILADLWNTIVSPVHDCLIELGVAEKSRIWWCPTSELCALPLHAAGLYLPKQKNLPDIYISSYIPSLSSLLRARSNINDESMVPKLLVVGQHETLPNVLDEINHVRQLGDFVDIIVGADATRDAVLHGLQQHSWAHFACHGRRGDNGEPFYGSFELHGGSRLTLLDLIQARLPNAELAFLAACHGARGDPRTPDESIHLAAALQFCGFRSVVGALWAIDDRDGPLLSKGFYEYMFRDMGNKVDFRDSAQALQHAIQAMRKGGVPLDRWIMFVHIGA